MKLPRDPVERAGEGPWLSLPAGSLGLFISVALGPGGRDVQGFCLPRSLIVSLSKDTWETRVTLL